MHEWQRTKDKLSCHPMPSTCLRWAFLCCFVFFRWTWWTIWSLHFLGLSCLCLQFSAGVLWLDACIRFLQRFLECDPRPSYLYSKHFDQLSHLPICWIFAETNCQKFSELSSWPTHSQIKCVLILIPSPSWLLNAFFWYLEGSYLPQERWAIRELEMLSKWAVKKLVSKWAC